MNISLCISPSQSAPRESPFSSNRRMTAWFESLPLANVEESTRQLTLAFEELRQHRISDALRYAFLEKVGPFLQTFLDEFERSLDLRRFPLPQVTITAAERTIRLEAAMVANYRVIMGDKGQQRIAVKPLARRRQLTAAFRVIQGLGTLLTICRRLHFTLPDDAWQVLFRAYCIGRRIARGPAAHRLDKAFRYHLAMSLIRPDDYPSAEFGAVRQLVRLLVSHGSKRESNATGAHLFPVDLDRSEGPAHYARAEDGPTMATDRYVLDLTGPVKQLTEALVALTCRRCDSRPAIMLPNLSAYRRNGVTIHYGSRSLRLDSTHLVHVASGFELFDLDESDFEKLMELPDQPEAVDELELARSFEEALARQTPRSSLEENATKYA